MAVFRVERTQNYTVMSNYHLRDKGISLKAKGLLSQMLSLPEDWDYTLTGLARINPEGKDAIRAAVRELEQAGYVQRRQTTDQAGKFASNEYIIRECPVSCPPPPAGPSCAFPSSGNPTTADPVTASTTPENPTQLNIKIQSKESKNKDLQSTEPIPFSSGAKRAPQQPEGKGMDAEQEMEAYRTLIRENICYDILVQERPLDAEQLDGMVELMVEAVCSKRKNIRVAGNDFPQAVVKSRILKLTYEHMVYVFDCLRENTTRVRNVKQYLLAVLYNAPTTMDSGYAAQVNHDLYGGGPGQY